MCLRLLFKNFDTLGEINHRYFKDFMYVTGPNWIGPISHFKLF